MKNPLESIDEDEISSENAENQQKKQKEEDI